MSRTSGTVGGWSKVTSETVTCSTARAGTPMAAPRRARAWPAWRSASRAASVTWLRLMRSRATSSAEASPAVKRRSRSATICSCRTSRLRASRSRPSEAHRSSSAVRTPLRICQAAVARSWRAASTRFFAWSVRISRLPNVSTMKFIRKPMVSGDGASDARMPLPGATLRLGLGTCLAVTTPACARARRLREISTSGW